MTGDQILHSVLLLVQIFAILMNLSALFFMLFRKNPGQQRVLIVMAFSTLMYNIANLTEIMPFVNFEVTFTAKCIETIAVACFQVPFLIFCFQYIGKTINIWILRVIVIIYSIISITQFNDIGRGYYYSKLEYNTDNPSFPHIECELGVVGWMFWILMVFAPVMLELVILSYGVIKERSRKKRKEGIAFIFQLLLIMIVFFATLPMIYKYGYNPMMLVAAIALSTKIFIGWRNQGLDIISIAAVATLDSLGYPVIVIDKDGKMLYCNIQAKSTVPSTRNYIGHNIKEFIQYAVDSGFAVGPHEFFKDGMMYHSEWNPIMDDDGINVGQSITFINVTAERMAVEEMKKEKIKADEENAAKSVFLANMSHEIRTPMNAIIGMSELIIEESRGRKVYDMAVQIKKASKNLLSIINNILDYSKMQAGKLELVEDNYYLKEIVEDTYNLIKIPAKERGLGFNLYLDDNLPCRLYGDDGKIRQVLINLLNNAIKFTKKGHVDLTVNGRIIGDGIELYFSVSDTGSGIKEEDQKSIFESFSQVDKINNKSIEGTGLGLAITQGLVSMLGGKITVSSVYGEGTTFSFTAHQRVVDSKSIKQYNLENEDSEKVRKRFISPKTKVLVCDDNKINIIVIKGMLDNYELDIESCTSGKEAIELVERKEYDVIMMDHMMPEMDGIETTDKIRVMCSSRSKKPYIFALTANSYEGAREMYISKGFDDFMSKPIDKLLLYDKLDEVIPDNKKKYVDEEVGQAAYTEDELAELFMVGVNVRDAVDNKGGKIDEYLELLDLFRLEGGRKKQEISDTYEAENFIDYEILVHGLKSTSLAVGAVDLSEKAKKHEFAAKDNDISFIKENYNNLIEEYDRILIEIENLLIKKKIIVKSSDEEKLGGMTDEVLHEKVTEILSLSEEFKSKEAQQRLDELLKYKIEKFEKDLEEVKVQFKMYNDDMAEDILYKILRSLEEPQEGDA